jgi:hypothetical protein
MAFPRPCFGHQQAQGEEALGERGGPVSEDARAEVRCFLLIIGRLENAGGVAATQIDLVAL